MLLGDLNDFALECLRAVLLSSTYFIVRGSNELCTMHNEVRCVSVAAAKKKGKQCHDARVHRPLAQPNRSVRDVQPLHVLQEKEQTTQKERLMSHVSGHVLGGLCRVPCNEGSECWTGYKQRSTVKMSSFSPLSRLLARRQTGEKDPLLLARIVPGGFSCSFLAPRLCAFRRSRGSSGIQIIFRQQCRAPTNAPALILGVQPIQVVEATRGAGVGCLGSRHGRKGVCFVRQRRIPGCPLGQATQQHIGQVGCFFICYNTRRPRCSRRQL